jgi:hypothetical protein
VVNRDRDPFSDRYELGNRGVRHDGGHQRLDIM